MKYVEFGYGEELDRQITKDGELLATMLKPDDLGKDEPDGLWERFVAAVGSDGHSGYSFGCAKSVACVLVKHGWKSVADIPQDSPLYERIRQ